MKWNRKAKKKLPVVTAYQLLAANMRGENVGMPTFPVRYHLLESDGADRAVVVEGPQQIVRRVAREHVIDTTTRYLVETDLINHPDFHWTPRTVSQAIDFFLQSSKKIKSPPAYLWFGEPGLTWSRLPWVKDPGVKLCHAPLWEKMLSRMSDPIAFTLFNGSILDMSSNLQQYMWIYGEGQDGKGSYSRVLKKMWGEAYTSTVVPNKEDRHWTSHLINSRVVVFPDCNNFGFTKTGLFKAMSGGDPVEINPKFQQPYTTILNAKFIFLSNETPLISSEWSDMRRIIYIQMSRGDDFTPGFERDLWDQAGVFMNYAAAQYQRSCPNHEPIKTDTTAITKLVEFEEDDLEGLVEEHFTLGENHYCPVQSFRSWAATYLRDRKKQRNFTAFFARKYGISLRNDARTSIMFDGRKIAAFRGFRLVKQSNYNVIPLYGKGELRN